MRIAYLILVHKDIEQVYKQIDVLSASNTFFFIHLDKKNKEKFNSCYKNKENVTFIKKRYKAYWGGFNIVRAEIALLTEAIDHKLSFDFYVLLSGQCFPIKSNREIYDFFKRNQQKIFLKFKKFPDELLIQGGIDKYIYPYFFDELGMLNDAYKKLIFKISKKLLKFINFERKFPNNYIPCFGSQWWALPKYAVEYVLDFTEKKKDFVNFFRHTWAPDELFFHTILYNSAYREQIINQSLWYIDWNTDGPPKTLTDEDYDQLKSSDKLFARKFDLKISSTLLRRIERYINL